MRKFNTMEKLLAKSEIIFSMRLGLATVWALGNYSIKLFRICNKSDAVMRLSHFTND